MTEITQTDYDEIKRKALKKLDKALILISKDEDNITTKILHNEKLYKVDFVKVTKNENNFEWDIENVELVLDNSKTYEDILKYKQTLKANYNKQGITFEVCIAPDNYDDFIKFFAYYQTHKITDDTAKLFCTDKKYAVYGVMRGDVYKFHDKIDRY